MKTKYAFLVAVMIMIAKVLLPGQPGALDGDFDGDGIVQTSILEISDGVVDVAVQADGKIIAAGWATSEIESSGTIGYIDSFALVRYHTDGSIDMSFGNDGIVLMRKIQNRICSVSAIALQQDGKIVATGRADDDALVLRFLPNGDLDPSFGTQGLVSIDFGNDYERGMDVTLQPDGKILVAGFTSISSTDSDFALARLHPNGAPDPGFSVDGKLTTDLSGANDRACSVTINPAGKITLTGTGDLKFALARYNPDGTLDHSFNQGGKALTQIGPDNYSNYVYSAALQPDGKTVVAGKVTYYGWNEDSTAWTERDSFAVVRYLTNGSLDPGFSNEGVLVYGIDKFYNEAHAVSINADGKIYVSGSTLIPVLNLITNEFEPHDCFSLTRLNQDGTFDESFGVNGSVTTDYLEWDYPTSMAIQENGRILVGGFVRIYSYNDMDEDFVVLRYLGSLDVGTVQFTAFSASPLIYPNPIHSHATLKYTLANAENLSIQLLDLQGRVVRTLRAPALQPSGDYEQAIDLSGLPGGAYVVVLASDKGRLGVRVVKQ